jgi:hypothetical protein
VLHPIRYANTFKHVGQSYDEGVLPLDHRGVDAAVLLEPREGLEPSFPVSCHVRLKMTLGVVSQLGAIA